MINTTEVNPNIVLLENFSFTNEKGLICTPALDLKNNSIGYQIAWPNGDTSYFYMCVPTSDHNITIHSDYVMNKCYPRWSLGLHPGYWKKY